MDGQELIRNFSAKLPQELAKDLVESFLLIRQDVMTSTLGRGAPGQFVENLVQILQFIDTGAYESKPSVDQYLRKLESGSSKLDDGLRICASRVARSMYTIRSKRSIVHKGEIDSNSYDLRYLHSAAQWTLAELARVVIGGSMHESGKLIEQIQAPIGSLLEDFGEYRIVLQDLTTKDELLTLLNSYYPDAVSTAQLKAATSRRSPDTVRKALHKLWDQKLTEGDSSNGYKLTQRGLEEASDIAKRYVNPPV